LNKPNKRAMLLTVTCLAVAAIAISLFAHWHLRFPGDLQLELSFQSLCGNGLLSLMKWVSYLMDSWRAGVIVIAGTFVTWRCLGRVEGGLAVVAGLSSLLNTPVKLLVDRPRPTADLVHVFAVETDSGFPSGHAMFAILVFGFLAYLAITHINRSNLRVLISTVLIFLILLTGASRVYLGVHWPSDVLGGYLIGGVILMILIYVYRTWPVRLELGAKARAN
jgi:membrane-associated phospholipid phosphatase